jgi:IrrE N-terminal-like domain
MLEPGCYTRSRIAALVDRALRGAGVAGVVPTPLDGVRDWLGIPAPEPIAELACDVSATRLPVIGAFSYRDWRMYVERGQSPARRRFTEAHELTHALCPWHEAALRLDTMCELFGAVRDAVEAEANAGAGMLLFQGREFLRRLDDGPPSIPTALALAAEHCASAHATIRHYVEVHPRPAALLMVGRFALKSGGLPLWGSVESQGFTSRFGSLRGRFGLELPAGSALHTVAEAARKAGLIATTLRLDGLGRVTVEGYYNRHLLLLLIAPLGLRSQIRASGAPGLPVAA